MTKFVVDKSKFLDTGGRPLTQGIFLEHSYDTKYAVYSIKDIDWEYKGKTYPSLKRLFLEHEDPTEYDFATTYLLGWGHWKRLNENKWCAPRFEEWREELELKLRSQAVRDIMDLCTSGSQGSFQAAKWLSDKGWDKRGAGRPSKQEIEKEKKLKSKLDEEFGSDVARMSDYNRS